VIAYRLTTVRSADLIVVLKNGELVEQGFYAELVAQGGWCAEPRCLRQAHSGCGRAAFGRGSGGDGRLIAVRIDSGP